MRISETTFLKRFFLLLVCLLMGNRAQAIEPLGYDFILNPNPTVVDVELGTAQVSNFFSLYHDGLPSGDISQVSINLLEDGLPVQFNLGEGQRNVGIIICMDLSGSMDNAIEQIKTNLTSFVNALERDNINVQVGIVTFGQSASPYLKVENEGNFYPDLDSVLQRISEFKADGSRERWFDALVYASQFPFNPTALRMAILITDEDAVLQEYDYSTALDIVTKNSMVVNAITVESQVPDAVNFANATKGKIYDFNSPFTDILYSIADTVVNSFNISFTSHAQLGPHEMSLVFNDTGKTQSAPFTIGANPIIKLVEEEVVFSSERLALRAVIEDLDGTVAYARVSLALSSGFTYGDNMVQDGTDFSFDYTFPSQGNKKVEFSIQAVDNEGRSTISGPWTYTTGKLVPTAPTFLPVTDPAPLATGKKQPVGVGDVINGGTSLSVSVDFPAYFYPDDSSARMNYYVALHHLESNSFFALKEDGLYIAPDFVPYAVNKDDLAFTTVFKIPIFSYFPKGKYTMYGVAVESANNMDQTLDFMIQGLPYDCWITEFEISDANMNQDIYSENDFGDFIYR